jgi:hypothetical protein
VRHRNRNRTALAAGVVARASDCHGAGTGRRKGRRSELLPAIPGTTPAPRPIDGEALAAELVRLAAMARRGWST